MPKLLCATLPQPCIKLTAGCHSARGTNRYEGDYLTYQTYLFNPICTLLHFAHCTSQPL